MVNKLYVGLSKEVALPKGGYLLIADEVPERKRIRVFDPLEDSLPIRKPDYKTARQLADVLYTIYPQGQDTLTVRGGRRTLARMLLKNSRLDKLEADLWRKAKLHEEDKKNNEPISPAEAEVLGLVSDILLSPVLRRVLCDPLKPFSFDPRSKIVARINRVELGDFDALVLGLFLMAHYKGQLVVPDFGFYGREAHVSLIREKRLIAGVNTLSELPPKLRQAALLIEDKQGSGTTFEDAEVLARYARLKPDPTRVHNPYNDFINEVMS